MSRILQPADYGLIGMAMPFILFSMMIADAGLGMSLVRVSAEDRDAWSSCFWLAVSLGLTMAAGMALSADVIALFFQQPDLAPVVRVLAVGVFLQSLTTIPGVMLQKCEMFKQISRIEIAAVVAGIGTAVTLAWLGQGVWALVFQQISFYLTRSVLTFALSPLRVRLTFHLVRVREHLDFSLHAFFNNLIGFVVKSLDSFIIGKFIGAEALGYYTMCCQFVRLPGMIVSGPLQYILYPRLTAMAAEGKPIAPHFLFFSEIVAIVVLPGMMMMSAAHFPVFELVLSPKWHVSAELFAFLGPIGAIQAITGLGMTAALAVGRSDVPMRISLEYGFLWLSSLGVAVHFGLGWVAFAYAAAVLLYLPRSLKLTLGLMSCDLASYVRALWVTVTIALIGSLAYAALAAAVTLPAALQIAVAVCIGLAVVAVIVRVRWTHLRGQVRALGLTAP